MVNDNADFLCPLQRLELKTEGDSVVDEMLNTSITEALVEQEQQKTEGQEVFMYLKSNVWKSLTTNMKSHIPLLCV